MRVPFEQRFVALMRRRGLENGVCRGYFYIFAGSIPTRSILSTVVLLLTFVDTTNGRIKATSDIIEAKTG